VRCNDQVVRAAKFLGEYHWHVHEQDELFLVHRGEITIQFRDRAALVLHEGEMGLVPKGIDHCPKSEGDSIVLMFEPATLQSAGNEQTS
jgi:mannose-6-phosphate isomerase-like protein (cupin superfamily)